MPVTWIRFRTLNGSSIWHRLIETTAKHYRMFCEWTYDRGCEMETTEAPESMRCTACLDGRAPDGNSRSAR